MAKGIDINFSCEHAVAGLKAQGVEFVGRYYAHTRSKMLMPPEAQALSSAGIKIVVVWETAPTAGSYFSYAKGVDDGTSAYQQALSNNQPGARPIYFAVDYDATSADVNGVIADYFRGVHDGFKTIGQGAPRYLIGAYGSGLACSTLLESRAVQYTWLAQSRGWRGSNDFTGWNIKQGAETKVAGLDVDLDEGIENYGGFIVPAV